MLLCGLDGKVTKPLLQLLTSAVSLFQMLDVNAFLGYRLGYTNDDLPLMHTGKGLNNVFTFLHEDTLVTGISAVRCLLAKSVY